MLKVPYGVFMSTLPYPVSFSSHVQFSVDIFLESNCSANIQLYSQVSQGQQLEMWIVYGATEQTLKCLWGAFWNKLLLRQLIFLAQIIFCEEATGTLLHNSNQYSCIRHYHGESVGRSSAGSSCWILCQTRCEHKRTTWPKSVSIQNHRVTVGLLVYFYIQCLCLSSPFPLVK